MQTLRFQEVLDPDRLARDEKSAKMTLLNAKEAPLSLKRSVSQSCDPHMAYITVELGSFEDTIGRVSTNIDSPKGSRSSSFSYKVGAKIPVDKVGLHRYPLDLNAEKQGITSTMVNETPKGRTFGWVIVRVALHGGIKMVTVESPLLIRNIADTDLLCEVRDHDGLSLLWRSLVPRASEGRDGYMAVPADIVPILHSKMYRFTVVALPRESRFQHESDVASCDKNFLTRLSPPKPYSRSSLSKGIIEAKHECVQLLKPETNTVLSVLHFHVCSLRIGSFVLEQSARGQRATRSEVEVPEQRMMLFRSPLNVINHLPFPVRVHVKVKDPGRMTSQNGNRADANRKSLSRPVFMPHQWFDLGIIDGGEDVSFSGAADTESIEIRVRFENSDGTMKREFPSWSTTTTVPAEMQTLGSLPKASSSSTASFSRLKDLKVLDASKVPLLLSVALSERGMTGDPAASCDNIKEYSEEIPLASRVVSLFTPFWIVDSTGLDLQFMAGSILAGQVDSEKSLRGRNAQGVHDAAHTLGLGELLDDNDLVYLPSRLSFEVSMVGNDRPKRLQLRRRQTRQQTVNNILSPWSEPIPLTLNENAYHDTMVLPPSYSFKKSQSSLPEVLQPFALRARIVKAPNAFGGMFGTKIVHIVCRYAVVNELGREIEICGLQKEAQPVTFSADEGPRPFHFDDTGPIHFRPKEFGWLWSGHFHVRRNRREVSLQLKHKLKGDIIMVTIEFHSKQDAGTCLLVLRLAPHAPYRVENRTIYPIQFRQISSFFDFERLSLRANNAGGTVILPYHDAEFALDEPESGQRSIAIRLSDLGDIPDNMNQWIGTFRIDRITPGTFVPLANSEFLGQVIADGPTRVIKVSEASRAEPRQHQNSCHEDFQRTEKPSFSSWRILVKLSHGIGVSVVDWSPQELLYIRLDELVLEQAYGCSKKTGIASIGRIIANDQRWITPFPICVRMGPRSSRRRHRRLSAVTLSWCLTDASYGDMTFFEWVELSTQPIMINVDGNLATCLIGMVLHAKHLEASSRGNKKTGLRDSELRRVLGIAENIDLKEKAIDRKALIAEDLYSAVDYMATSAIAAKLRYRYRPPNQTAHIIRRKHPLEIVHLNLMSKRHKYYIERLRISTTAAQISWSGPLPIASQLPRFLRPALTFEGLPVLLRPLSCVHAYGTTGDHIQNIKSHYISMWSILSTMVGILANPTFILRACIFTGRESFSTVCDLISSGLATSENALLKLIPSATALPQKQSASAFFGQAALKSIVEFQATMIHGLVKLTSAGAHMSHYNAARHRSRSGLVRTRNPRLFANVDGQDLLVSYVEGDNAGKALLSRVRMGAHLSEGYMGHFEGIYVKSRSNYQAQMSPSNYIVMLTFERILLLNGQLNEFFCDVVWEAQSTELVYIESKEVSGVPAYILVLLWFLQHDGRGTSREERKARILVGDTSGLGALVCRQFFVPKASYPLFSAKIKQVNSDLMDLEAVAG